MTARKVPGEAMPRTAHDCLPGELYGVQPPAMPPGALPVPVFSWKRSRYAKGLEVVTAKRDGSLFMTREQRLAAHFARRYSHREGGYLMSARAVSRLIQAWREGYDASPISGDLIPPRQEG